MERRPKGPAAARSAPGRPLATPRVSLDAGPLEIRDARDLGDAVRAGRVAAGLTQQGAADALGMTRTTLLDLERGARGVSHETALRALTDLGFRVLLVPPGAAGLSSAAWPAERRREAHPVGPTVTERGGPNGGDKP